MCSIGTPLTRGGSSYFLTTSHCSDAPLWHCSGVDANPPAGCHSTNNPVQGWSEVVLGGFGWVTDADAQVHLVGTTTPTHEIRGRIRVGSGMPGNCRRITDWEPSGNFTAPGTLVCASGAASVVPRCSGVADPAYGTILYSSYTAIPNVPTSPQPSYVILQQFRSTAEAICSQGDSGGSVWHPTGPYAATLVGLVLGQSDSEWPNLYLLFRDLQRYVPTRHRRLRRFVSDL